MACRSITNTAALVFDRTFKDVLVYVLRYNSQLIFIAKVFDMSKLSVFYLLILLVLTGCSAEGTRKLPGVYRIDIQQGNVIEQEMLDKLRPGMVKDQVHFIMGTPTIVDPFRVDRWEYIYTFSRGGDRRLQRHITIFFKENKLAYLEGGVVRGIRKPPEEYRKERKTVDVPSRRKKKGFMSRLVNVLPFVGDDEPKARTKVKEKAEEELSENDVDASPPELESDKTEADEKTTEPAAVEKKKKGFFSKLVNALPFVGDDDKTSEDSADSVENNSAEIESEEAKSSP